MDAAALTEELMAWLPDMMITFGTQVITALLILCVGLYVSNKLSAFIYHKLEASRLEASLSRYIAAAVKALIFTFVILLTLARLGVQTASIIAVLGAAGLAVGLALQGSLSNIASGVLIVLLRPFKVGDYVQIGGEEGHVEMIGIFTTELKTLQGVTLVIPNASITADTVKNYTKHKVRRADFTVGVAYGSDLKQAKAVLTKVAEACPYIVDHQPVTVEVDALADSSVNFTVRVWVEADCYPQAELSIYENAYDALGEANITIPFPQMDVHMHTVAAQAAALSSQSSQEKALES